MGWQLEDELIGAFAIAAGALPAALATTVAIGAVSIGCGPSDAELEAAMQAAMWDGRSSLAQAVEEVEPAGVPVTWEPLFSANSLRTGFSVQGTYVGHMYLTIDGALLDLSRASAVSTGRSAGTTLTGIRLSLAERTDSGGWRFVERGELYPVGVDMSGTTRWVKWGGMQIELKGAPYYELGDGRWFVIEHELWVDDSAGGHKAWTYAHGDPDFNEHLLATLEDGC